MVKDWESSRLDEKCPGQVGYVYDRLVCFQVQLVCVAGLSGGRVLVLWQDRRASSSRQDGNSIGQDGKCNRQAIYIHNRTVSRWAESKSEQRVGVG